jgi:cysteinyl-tRNA synthetase
LENRKKINLLEPDVICKATDHIKEMVELNQKLIKKGVAYETDDALYFDVTKFSKYGRLSGNTLGKLKAGARIEINPNKKHPYDFALWMKAVGKHESHAMVWNSPWGKGFPGWHIECSAMSMKYLGESFDIHTGGEDNIFPHHECEIAQSESATGKKFVNYWVHTRFLMVEGEKMSKSLKNFFRIQDIEKKGFNPLALRYLFLTTHYRSNLNFTWNSLKAARSALDNLYEMITDIKSEKNKKDFKKEAKAYHKNFLNFINDDLNVPQALALAWETLKDENLDNQEKYNLLLDFDKVFGLGLKNLKEAEIPEKIKTLVEQREKYRQKKDFKKADEIRKEIEEMGFGLEDTSEETKVKPL